MSKEKDDSNARKGSGVGGFWTLTFVALMAVGVAMLFTQRQKEIHLKEERMRNVLRSLIKQEKETSVTASNEDGGHQRGPKVAVGYGACRDLFVEAGQLLQRVGLSPPEEVGHFDQIGDGEQLRKMFAYFFKHGAAAEYEFFLTFRIMFASPTDRAPVPGFHGGRKNLIARNCDQSRSRIVSIKKFKSATLWMVFCWVSI